MKKTLAIAILCTLSLSHIPIKTTDSDLTIEFKSSPTIVDFKGLKEVAQSFKAFTQEMQKFPSYITHAQRSMHIAGTMFIGCALCCAGIYSFIKNDKKTFNDYCTHLGFIAAGTSLVIFSPVISRAIIPALT